MSVCTILGNVSILLSGSMRVTRSVGSGPGFAVRKRIVSGCVNLACMSLLGSLLLSVMRSCISIRSMLVV